MYPEAITQLTCPRHPDTRLSLDAGARAADGALLDGALVCPRCAARYRIRGGIADLIGPWRPPASPAQLVNALPITAWGYERLWRHRALSLLAGEPLGYPRELPLISGLLAPERGGLYIDVACSNGLYARAIARGLQGTAGHVIGIDHSMAMLRQARAYAQAEGLRISFVRAKAQALPCADGAAAGVAMGGSLNEIGDADSALRELARALAPDGRCTLMCLVRAESAAGRALQLALGGGGVSFDRLDRLNRRIAAAGLRLRAQWRHRVVVFSLLTT